MDFFKKSSKFFGKCSESSDSSRKLKISKSIFPIQNGSKHLNFFFKIGCFQKKFKIFWKMLRIFWFIQKMKNLKIYIFQYKMGQNTCKFFKNRIFQKCSKLSDLTKKLEIFICVFKITEKASLTACYFQGEPLETGSIHNSGYWKIAGLTACYFQGNSWKLGVFIIQVIGK